MSKEVDKDAIKRAKKLSNLRSFRFEQAQTILTRRTHKITGHLLGHIDEEL